MVEVLPWFSKNNKLHGSGLLNLLLTVQLVLHGLWSGLPSFFFFFLVMVHGKMVLAVLYDLISGRWVTAV